MKTAKAPRPVFGKKQSAPVRLPLTQSEMAAIAEAREWIGKAAPLDMAHIRQIAARA